MPCNFISSCFFLETPWNRDPDCSPNPSNNDNLQGNHNHNNNQGGGGGGGGGGGVEQDPWELQQQDPHQQQQQGLVDPNNHNNHDNNGGNPLAVGPNNQLATVDQPGQGGGGGGVAVAPPNTETSMGGGKAVPTVPKTMKTFRAYLPSCHRTYSCVHCRAHLANHDELISKSFQGSQGRAYLFNSVVNIGCGPAEERILLTGLHAVADIFCDCCKTTLGWKYEQAFESSQKYKEGKYIIELAHMIKENGWENES